MSIPIDRKPQERHPRSSYIIREKVISNCSKVWLAVSNFFKYSLFLSSRDTCNIHKNHDTTKFIKSKYQEETQVLEHMNVGSEKTSPQYTDMFSRSTCSLHSWIWPQIVFLMRCLNKVCTSSFTKYCTNHNGPKFFQKKISRENFA